MHPGVQGVQVSAPSGQWPVAGTPPLALPESRGNNTCTSIHPCHLCRHPSLPAPGSHVATVTGGCPVSWRPWLPPVTYFSPAGGWQPATRKSCQAARRLPGTRACRMATPFSLIIMEAAWQQHLERRRAGPQGGDLLWAGGSTGRLGGLGAGVHVWRVYRASTVGQVAVCRIMPRIIPRAPESR